MRRILGLSLVTFLLLMVPSQTHHAQVVNALTRVTYISADGDCDNDACTQPTRAMCLETAGSGVLYVCGAGGFMVPSTAGGVAVSSGSRIGFEGQSGDTYLLRDADTGFIQVYRDGVLRATITGSGVIPGACPSDLYGMEMGTSCIDATGRSIVVTPSGPAVVTGAVP